MLKSILILLFICFIASSYQMFPNNKLSQKPIVFNSDVIELNAGSDLTLASGDTVTLGNDETKMINIGAPFSVPTSHEPQSLSGIKCMVEGQMAHNVVGGNSAEICFCSRVQGENVYSFKCAVLN
eukprot:TRINITY_DN1354_c0_g1_i1.p1 TRINITY_DN1354_c0_g1~~TRINITY_DN1354_c0_g1_i1.p1  ORF type:complete len:125 (+),score=37.05 TRINITY_DN1354_c0_g1_i1:57-431(+)